MDQYHCFWVNPYGMGRQYEAHDDLAKVLVLVKQNESENGSVRGLRVVYGELLEFEPAVVVESYKVKDRG